MRLARLFRRDPTTAAAAGLYQRAVAQARLPAFYAAGGVPDSLDGRFELITLHVFVLLHRLKGAGQAGADLAQALFDTMFADMDAQLRELGAGDLGVPPRIKRMISGFYGRVAAYETALAGTDEDLAEALRRNLYGTADPGAAGLAGAAAYLRQAVAAIAAQPLDGLLRGEVSFPAPRLEAGALKH